MLSGVFLMLQVKASHTTGAMVLFNEHFHFDGVYSTHSV